MFLLCNKFYFASLDVNAESLAKDRGTLQPASAIPKEILLGSTSPLIPTCSLKKNSKHSSKQVTLAMLPVFLAFRVGGR